MSPVKITEKKVIIPTYEIKDYDKNPMFIEKRVYQGSSGRVYPHPVCEGVSDVKTDKEYNAIFLENDYILVMILPELGGRIQRLYDKTNGYDAVYYNEVIKPALVGLAGPWICGGIEFNWPQHHRPSTYDPVDYSITKNDDGSVTVWVGEIEKMFHTKGEAGFTLYPDKAYLEIKGRVYNPTDFPKTFLWWANPAVSVNDYTRSIFPPDVNAVMDHGKRDVSKFPMADGIYYKVNYAPGTDISRYKNIHVPTSYMAYHSDYDFIGNYDDSKEAGLLHVADHHVSPGKKQWTWGNGDFGKAWDRNLTDENGPYIELMTGMFTDNQPDFTYLKPLEEKSFVQYFMPYKKIGSVKVADKDLSVGIENESGNICVSVYSASDNEVFSLKVFDENNSILQKDVSLNATEVYSLDLKPSEWEINSLSVKIIKNGKEVLSYIPKTEMEPIPNPANEMELPEDVKSNEELYLDGLHLEQYRHATYKPEDYYLEGLRRDPTDLRINNAYGRLLYSKGYFEESLKYFEASIKKSTFRNPNPYDCEPYFNYGVALFRLSKLNEAFDAFYKATWDGNMRDKAYFHMSLIECRRGNYEKAYDFINESLLRGAHNLRARTLKTALLRTMGKNKEGFDFARETFEFDPLDFGAVYEMSLFTKNDDELIRILRNDSGNIIELAILYMEAGLDDDALRILDLYKGENPLVEFYKYYINKDEHSLSLGEKASSLYCFPNRIEDISILKNAYSEGSNMAAYYLGLLYYDKGNWEKAFELWNEIKDSINLPTVHRNLSLIYFNKLHDEKKAEEALKRAFDMDTSDSRIFFELDQYYKIQSVPAAQRLEKLMLHKELLETRDDLFTEYISLLNQTGKYDEALALIKSHNFHPWEGGEGKITKEYRTSLIELARLSENHEEAIILLNEALTYPDNLGEGKLIGALDNDIYYYLGCFTDDVEKANEFFAKGARGEMNLSSAMYYNDQPPEMMYFRNLSLAKLGNTEEAKQAFEEMIEYGNQHMNDQVSIDYFAVSLPDFLLFEGNLNDKNRLHCSNMINLGKDGLNLLTALSGRD